MTRITRSFAAALLLAVPAVANAQDAEDAAKKADPPLDLRREGRRQGAGQGRDRPGPAGCPPGAGHVRRGLVRLVPQAPRPLRLRPGDPPAARRRVRPGHGRHPGAPRRRPAGRMPGRPDGGGLPVPGRPRRPGQGRHPPGDGPAGGGRPPRPGQGEGLPGGVGRTEGRGVEGLRGGPGEGVERGQARLPPFRRPHLRVVPQARRLPRPRGHGADPRPRVRGRQGRPRPDDGCRGDPQEVQTRRVGRHPLVRLPRRQGGCDRHLRRPEGEHRLPRHARGDRALHRHAQEGRAEARPGADRGGRSGPQGRGQEDRSGPPRRAGHFGVLATGWPGSRPRDVPPTRREPRPSRRSGVPRAQADGGKGDSWISYSGRSTSPGRMSSKEAGHSRASSPGTARSSPRRSTGSRRRTTRRPTPSMRHPGGVRQARHGALHGLRFSSF